MRVINNIFTVMDTILFIEKRFKFHYKGITLFPKEIHLVLLISETQDINAKTMAERLGVTKGAISQTLTRLEKKGILYKEKKPQQKNELIIKFTKPGKEAAEHFKKLKMGLAQQYDQCLAEFSGKERKTINKFLIKMDTILKGI